MGAQLTRRQVLAGITALAAANGGRADAASLNALFRGRRHKYGPPAGLDLYPIFDRSGFPGSASTRTDCKRNSVMSATNFHIPDDVDVDGIVACFGGWYGAGNNGVNEEVPEPYDRWLASSFQPVAGGANSPFSFGADLEARIKIPAGPETYFTNPLTIGSPVSRSTLVSVLQYERMNFRPPSAVIAVDGSGIATLTRIVDSGFNLSSLLTVSVANGGTGYTFTPVVVGGRLTGITIVNGTGKTTGNPSVTFSNGIAHPTSIRRVLTIDTVNAGTNLVDQTVSGTITSIDEQYRMPMGVFATSVSAGSKHFVLLGDSLSYGNSDSNTTGDAGGRIGIFSKAFAGSHGRFSPSVGGTYLQGYLKSVGLRRQLIQLSKVGTVLMFLGYNDIMDSSGPTLAQMKAFLRYAFDDLSRGGRKVWCMTAWPKATTTDAYVTVLNQTPTRPTREPIRFAYNDDMLANFAAIGFEKCVDINVAISANDDPYIGKFKVLNPDPNTGIGTAGTSDGTHPSAALITSIVASGAIPTTLSQ